MKTLAIALVLCMVPFANLNPVLYAIGFPWHRSREGRAVMNGLVGLALLVDGAVFYTFAPNFPGKPIVSVVVYSLILVGMVRMTYALVRLLWARRSSAA